MGSALDVDELCGNAGLLQVLIQDLGLVDRYQVVIGAVEDQESRILLIDIGDGARLLRLFGVRVDGAAGVGAESGTVHQHCLSGRSRIMSFLNILALALADGLQVSGSVEIDAGSDIAGEIKIFAFFEFLDTVRGSSYGSRPSAGGIAPDTDLLNIQVELFGMGADKADRGLKVDRLSRESRLGNDPGLGFDHSKAFLCKIHTLLHKAVQVHGSKAAAFYKHDDRSRSIVFQFRKQHIQNQRLMGIRGVDLFVNDVADIVYTRNSLLHSDRGSVLVRVFNFRACCIQRSRISVHDHGNCCQ